MIPVSSIASGPRRLADVSGMPATVPMPTKNPGDVLTSALWNTYVRDNIDKLLSRGHRVLTVAQFGALTGLEGTKGSVPPDEVYLEVDSTNGIQWHLAYESGEPTYKWRFLGGEPLYAAGSGATFNGSSLWTNLLTIVTPRAGDYRLTGGFFGVVSAAGIGTYEVGYGVTNVNQGNDGQMAQSASLGFTCFAADRILAAVASGTSLNLQYWSNQGGTAGSHFFRVQPRRLI